MASTPSRSTSDSSPTSGLENISSTVGTYLQNLWSGGLNRLQKSAPPKLIENCKTVVHHVQGYVDQKTRDFQKYLEVSESLSTSVSLQDAPNFHFVAPRLYIMEYPETSIYKTMAYWLEYHHPAHYRILNFSEREYPIEIKNAFCTGEIFNFHYKGLPAPPLYLTCKICLFIHSWYASDPENVLLLHCYRGYSRTAFIATCFLYWAGLSPTIDLALKQTCCTFKLDENMHSILLSPSQKRYLQYFKSVLDGANPQNAFFSLETIALSTLSNFSKPTEQVHEIHATRDAFQPHFQVWHGGKIIFSSSSDATSVDTEPSNELQIYPIQVTVSGDCLIRVRHSPDNKSKKAAFCYAFHTSFIQEQVEVNVSELDLACQDSRFDSNFKMILHFKKLNSNEFDNFDTMESANVNLFDRFRKESKKAIEENSLGFDSTSTDHSLINKKKILDPPASQLLQPYEFIQADKMHSPDLMPAMLNRVTATPTGCFDGLDNEQVLTVETYPKHPNATIEKNDVTENLKKHVSDSSIECNSKNTLACDDESDRKFTEPIQSILSYKKMLNYTSATDECEKASSVEDCTAESVHDSTSAQSSCKNLSSNSEKNADVVDSVDELDIAWD